jgi:hypothetical protein
MLRQAPEKMVVVHDQAPWTAAPQRNRAILDRFACIRDHQFWNEYELRSESVAFGTGTVRAVERKIARQDLAVAEVAGQAREMFAVRLFAPPVGLGFILYQQVQPTAAHAQCQFRRIRQARGRHVARYQSVHNRFNRVPFVLFQLDVVFNRTDIAVDADADEAVVANRL